MPPAFDAETDTEGSSLPRRGTYQLGADRERDLPPPHRWLRPLAICVGTFTLLAGVTVSGAAVHHRTRRPLPYSCWSQQAPGTHEPTPAPLLSPLGSPAASRSCGATVPHRTPAPTPEPAPRAAPSPSQADAPSNACPQFAASGRITRAGHLVALAAQRLQHLARSSYPPSATDLGTVEHLVSQSAIAGAAHTFLRPWGCQAH